MQGLGLPSTRQWQQSMMCPMMMKRCRLHRADPLFSNQAEPNAISWCFSCRGSRGWMALIVAIMMLSSSCGNIWVDARPGSEDRGLRSSLDSITTAAPERRKAHGTGSSIASTSIGAAESNDFVAVENLHPVQRSWFEPNRARGLDSAGSLFATPTSFSSSTTTMSESSTTIRDKKPEMIHVLKRNGTLQALNATKIYRRLQVLAETAKLDARYVDLTTLTASIVRGMYPNVTTQEIDILAAESAASLSTQHPDYARLASRVLLTQNHKDTPPSFSAAMDRVHDFIHPTLLSLLQRRGAEIDAHIVPERDFDMTYFGFKTLQRAYLLKDDDGKIVERPQYLLMRVALGIHCTHLPSLLDSIHPLESDRLIEDECLKAALETYDFMSRGLFTHASPTLFHAGTTHAYLSSCFLVQMSSDSIDGIYDTLKRCAVISKAAGGVGLSVHNIRARGTPIRGTRGVSNGLVPMLRVFDVTSRYVDQGGGKRPGAFAVYMEPWHADILDVLQLKKNHGKEEHRARNLFYGLWIPDLFMKRVQEDGIWSLMCPHQCPGLQETYGAAFEQLYEQYEQDGKFVRQIRARELWSAILDAQIETGNPYMLFKDSCNAKSNQQNLGTIQCSNLCTEIIQYTDPDEIAVCNLASLCLPRFVQSRHGPFGSIQQHHPDDQQARAYFDHEALHHTTKIITRNLNKVIDINNYPVEEARRSNFRHRPIGIGVSGLADVFLRLGLPFTSPTAKRLNAAIFETIYHAALEASAELAERDGPYGTFTGSPASQGQLQFNLWGLSDQQTPSHQYYREEAVDGSDNRQPIPMQKYPDFAVGTGYKWDELRQRIIRTGLRNSLLLAPMPTASTSQILGVNECFEPFSSNLYLRRVKAGEFIMANPHLLQDLTDRGLWTPSVRNQLMRDGGSVQKIAEIPNRLKELYKTVWELKMKDIIDMAADRGAFIDQSQSLNLFLADPDADKMTAMHFYAWRKGLKTGMYYLRTKPAVNAIQYTVRKQADPQPDSHFEHPPSLLSSHSLAIPAAERDDVCLSCQG